MNGCTDNVKTVYPPQTKFAGCIKLKYYNVRYTTFQKDTFSEENQERLTKTLSVLFPDLSGEGLDKHVQNTLQCMALLKTYRPLCMYHRDLTLVKADMSASVPDMPDDYGLSEVGIDITVNVFKKKSCLLCYP